LGTAVNEAVQRTVSNRFALERYLRGAERTLTGSFMSGLEEGLADIQQPVALLFDTYEEMEGARGNSFHALVNAVYLLPETPLWVGGTLQGELSYNYLDKITENEERFNGHDEGCTSAYRKSCVDDQSLGLQVGFTPEWPQAFAGWDMSMPTSVAYGLDGNSPTLGGTNEGVYNYSIGVAADYQGKHFFTAKWIDSHGEYEVNPASGYVTSDHTVGSPVQNDHGWLSFTYKVTL
jgi:hypothetical protein